ncbi:hypothetical protein JHK82_051348 [Glycine max]|nr:hypothetical protein JHK82_051348 [Glycine max]
MPCSAQSLEVQVQNRNKDIITEVEQGATSSCISLFSEKVIYNLESMEISLKEAEWLQKYITSQFEKLNIGELSIEKHLGSCKPHFT